MTYPLFRDHEIWSIFSTMVLRDVPLPGLEDKLAECRPEFDRALDRLKQEHGTFKSRYYRKERGQGFVNPIYLEHFLRLAYWFSREVFLAGGDTGLCDAVFLAIKSRGAIDLYYEFDLKSYFYPAHAFGTVMGRATYAPHFVILQNCTVGNNKGIYPVFGEEVILRPGAMVLGNCKVGRNVQFAAGSMVIDMEVPDDTLVIGRHPHVAFKANRVRNLSLFFDAD